MSDSREYCGCAVGQPPPAVADNSSEMARDLIGERRLRPGVGGRGGEIDIEEGPSFRQSMLRRLGSLGGAHGRNTGPRGTAGAADVRAPSPRSRRCVVKAHFRPMNAAGRRVAALHLAYIERDGVERDGSKGQLYGRDDAFDRVRLSDPVPDEKRQFRFIVSPEDGAELDLTAYTRALMAQMEADLGRRFVWGAVNHWNTDNPHVHVVVRGVDAGGRDVSIGREYIKSGLRWRAQEILTRELGPRADVEISAQRSKEITQERFTSIDRLIEPLAGADGRITLAQLAASVGDSHALCIARLASLEQLQLASRVSPREWQLVTGWSDSLKALGQRNDIIKRMHQALGQGRRVDIIDPTHEFPAIEGIVRSKGLHDELAGDLYAVVETPAGTTHYVQLPQSQADAIHEGAVVSVTSDVEPWVRPSDRAIQELATRNAGTYDPAAQRAALERRPAAPGLPAPAALVEANERRLARLERYGLVARLPDGRWRVPADLVSQLEARERSHPRRNLHVRALAPPLRAQIPYRGPTWLDSQVVPSPDEQALRPGDTALASALQQRAAYLRQLGVPAAPPARDAALVEMERIALVQQLATERRLSPALVLPERFAGRLFACETPSGRRYVSVVDDAAATFVLLPAPPDAKRLEGRPVVVSRCADGRLQITTANLSRGDLK